MEEMEQMNTEELLKQVNTAIRTVLIGGQSYQIGSRKLTRADLSLLRQMQKELQAEGTRRRHLDFWMIHTLPSLMGGENGELVGCSNRIRVS